MKHLPQRAPGLGLARLLVFGLVAMMLLSPWAGVAAQDQNAEAKPTQDPAIQIPNDPTAPQPNANETPAASEPEQTAPQETPAPRSTEPTTSEPPRVTRSTERNDPATGPGFPAVLGHGLVYVSGDDIVWQVRETSVPSVSKARSTTSNGAVVFQRDGTSIIRNDVTGKRAKLDPGEGYFRAAGDGYTVMADSDSSVIWMFELVDPDDVAMDAFYESPTITNLGEGTYDMMLTRFVLTPGTDVDLPRHNGAGLVMVATGGVEVDVEGKRGALGVADGQTIQGDAIVSNTGDSDAVVVYAYLGDKVSDETAGAGTGQSGSSSSGSSESSSGSQANGDSGTLQDEAAASDGSTDTPSTDDAGNYITSINVTANSEIYLVITVDGLTVFDGNLPAGASSGPVVGSEFTVYTSYGANTIFTNACGDTFQMGYEEGEATYVLTATAESCAP